MEVSPPAGVLVPVVGGGDEAATSGTVKIGGAVFTARQDGRGYVGFR